MSIIQICKNCADYDSKKGECTIRYTRMRTDTKQSMKRKPTDGGCVVFMSKAIYSTKAN